MTDSLDLLLETAMAQARRRPTKSEKPLPAMRDASEKRPRISSFQNPDNWTATKVITLIHREPRAPAVLDTLLGNFQEYLHKTGARRLVRITEPTLAEATEYVSGDWWLPPSREEAHHAEVSGRWTKVFRFCIGVSFAELRLHAPSVPVLVTTNFGHLQNVELCDTVKFFSGDGREFLMLHPGTDILECMNLDSKLDLRAMIEAEEADNDEGDDDASL